MATYSLSGTGVQALSAGVTAAHVTITTTPTNIGQGTANPANYYHVALLRFGDATGYFDAVPVVGGPQWLAVPAGTTRLGYACQNGAVISLQEVIGGTPPFGGVGALSSLSDVALTSPADAQVLAYQASSSKWINSTPSGGGGGLVHLATVTLASPSPTIGFSSISQSYRHLKLEGITKSDQAVTMQVMSVRLNGDTTLSHYTNSGGVNSTSSQRIGSTGGSSGVGAYTRFDAILPNYTNASSATKYLAAFAGRTDGTVEPDTSHWTPTTPAAVTQIELFPVTGNFVAGSIMSLYGLP